MDLSLIKSISIFAFLAAVGLMAIVSLLTVYTFIRYGPNKSLTVVASLVFLGVFSLGAVVSFIILLTIF